MAILYVLWGVGILAVIAASLLSTGNVSYRLAQNALEAARLEAAAGAAFSRAVLALLDPRPEQRWRIDGVPVDFDFDGIKMRISVQDELGRIDLNHADQPMLVGLFRSAGLDAPAADGLADKILDWRDANPARRLHGAKAPEYRAAGHRYGPRNGPFQSVDELRLVMGMDSSLYERVAPALTVYSGRHQLDPQFAPREALLALPTMNADTVAALIAGRSNPGPRGGVVDPAMALNGRAFSVRTEIVGTRSRQVREAVVRFRDHPQQPNWVLSWRMR
jgi:general secretion pathway protein K